MGFEVFEKGTTDGIKSTVSVCNVGNDCLVRSSSVYGEALTFVPCVNIDCSVEPRVLKSTGFDSTVNNFQIEANGITVGELAKAVNELNAKVVKENGIQEVE